MLNVIGQDIGRYHILEPLGEGGMAIVYKAMDKRLEREVAIKFIRKEAIPEDQADRVLKRFEREAKSLGNFMHPNIVPIIDYGEYENNPYLVMPYLPGGTLKDRAGTPMHYREAAKLLAPVARALEHAHHEGIIHRDIKPANILITRQGQPMLSDFGIAKILFVDEGQTLTGTGVGIGTPKYMAPEQWQNQISPQTDVYALGIVYYEIITGHLPFDANTPAGIFAKQLTERPQPLNSFIPGIPAEVQQVLDKALARDVKDRYANITVFAEDLEKLAQGISTGMTPIPVYIDQSATVDIAPVLTPPSAGASATIDYQPGQAESRTVTMDPGSGGVKKASTPIPVISTTSNQGTVRMGTINPTPTPPAAPKQKSGSGKWIWLGIGGAALLLVLGVGLVLLFFMSQGWSISLGEPSATPAAQVIVVTATPLDENASSNNGQQNESQPPAQEAPTNVPSPQASDTPAVEPTAQPTVTKVSAASNTNPAAKPDPELLALPTFTISNPKPGTAFEAAGLTTFSWSEFAGASSYRMDIFPNHGKKVTFMTNTTTKKQYIESLPWGGEFIWQVVALDSSGKPIGFSGQTTFTKPILPGVMVCIDKGGGGYGMYGNSGCVGGCPSCVQYKCDGYFRSGKCEKE
ncbi:MAG: protein kinase [Chloroflexota bacterium]|jgi:serine/threonine protein kinase